MGDRIAQFSNAVATAVTSFIGKKYAGMMDNVMHTAVSTILMLTISTFLLQWTNIFQRVAW